MRHVAIAALLFFVNAVSFAQMPTTAHQAAVDAKAEARESAIAVGDAAPDFELADDRGGTTRLSATGDAKATVLVFYRGYW